MLLTDILPLEEWVALEQEIHEHCGMNAAVSDVNGMRITKYANWGNELCPLIKSTPQGIQAICSVANQNMTARAKQERKPIVDECDAGFVKISVPIFADDEFLGTAGCCGLPLEGSEMDPFFIEKSAGVEQAKTEKLLKDCRRITPEQAQEGAKYVAERLAAHLAKRAA